MEVCEEMQKLREYLNKHNIQWTDVSEPYCFSWMCRTHFTLRNNHWSVINGYGSYGGFGTFSPNNEGLLELMTSEVNGGEPVGYLTADDVIKYMYPG